MLKNKIKRYTCIFTAAMMILSSGTGCRKNSKDSNGIILSGEEIRKTLSYTVSDIEPDETGSYNIKSRNGLIYAAVNKTEQQGDVTYSKCYIAVMDETGKRKLDIPVYEQTEDGQFCTLYDSLIIDDDGNITCMTDIVDPFADNDSKAYQLLTFAPDGSLLSAMDIGPVISADDYDKGRSFNGFIIDSEGNIYCNLYTCVRVLDKTGSVLFTTKDIESGSGYVQFLVLTDSGIPMVCISQWGDEPVYKFAEIDVTAGGFGTEHILPGEGTDRIYPGRGDHLCYILSDTGISGFREDTLQKEAVLNLLNLGIDTTMLDIFIPCDDGSFIIGIWEYDGIVSVMTYHHIKPSDSPETKDKQVITLGCFSIDMFWRSEIAYFNRTNEDYIISVVSYSDNNDTFDYDAAITKFNNELIAGNVPDMLILYNHMPFDSYIEKGLLADLYPLIDNDPDLSRDSFLPNILSALETDGKLCRMAVGFNISTYAARSSLAGSKNSLTFDEANKLLSGLPEGAELTNDIYTQMDFLRIALRYNDFTDRKKGTCNFDSPEFKEILETAKTYPSEADIKAVNYTEKDLALLNNTALLYSVYLNDFDSFSRTQKGFADEEITLVGFPNNDGANGSLNIDTMIAVSEKSQLKEGALEFIKSVLENLVIEEEYSIFSPYTKDDTDPVTEMRWGMNKLYMGGFPVLTEDIERLGAQATVPFKTINKAGEIVPRENGILVGGAIITTEPPTPEEVRKYINYLSSVDNFYTYDRQLYRIIEEEASAFFAGAKTADETAQMIQSRVSIYMSE